MEKRIFGIILTILGIAGLIMSASSFINSSGSNNVRAIIMYGVLGLVFFFAGIGLLRSTHDKAT